MRTVCLSSSPPKKRSTQGLPPSLSADEAASFIANGDTVALSGFTFAGCPKAVPGALAKRAQNFHDAHRPFAVNIIAGASTGHLVDGELAKAHAIAFRTPYQSDPDLRKLINSGETKFCDMHLSTVAENLRRGILGKIDWGIIEASDVTPNGEIVLTSAVGLSPTIARIADRLIIELNHHHPKGLRGFHDCYEPNDPPARREIPIFRPSDRIGSPCIKVDPKRIMGIVVTNQKDEISEFDEASETTKRIGQNVAEFLLDEMRVGRLPSSFLPVQSGVGNIANAVLASMGANPDIPRFEMFTEVIQNSVIELLQEGRIKFASGVSLTVTRPMLQRVYDDLEFFRSKILLRPQEISNSPEVVHRLGLITINTALEVDLFGNVNSTHVMGRQMMNGIGGSGDFTRNAYLSIFTCPSVAKGGKISALVPMVSHVDHNEHSVSVIVTEQGVADLRGKSPQERAELIVRRCAHPDFREELNTYFRTLKSAHTPQTLSATFAMHQQFLKTGDMRGVDWAQYL